MCRGTVEFSVMLCIHVYIMASVIFSKYTSCALIALNTELSAVHRLHVAYRYLFFFLLKCNVHLSDCLLSFSQCVLTILCTLQCTSNFSSDDQRVAVLFIPFWREFTQDGQLLRRGLSSTVTAGRHCGNGSPELNQQL